MTQPTCTATCVRCQQNAAAETDCPADPMRYVPAGDACGTDCDGLDVPSDLPLATAFVNVQTYRTGFCPSEALMKGTLFPELVSPYTRGC